MSRERGKMGMTGAKKEGEGTARTPRGGLGTFSGVFTPSILTILGIILFLRLGYVVGSAGLARALVMILVANGISVLTTLSLSAISTNLKVKGGGDYYLISRTLGLEFGGAIGIVLFLAQSVSIAFYCIGFGEALADILPYSHPLLAQGIAGASVALLFLLAWLGTDWATRFQYGVMAILAAALLSFFVGGLSAWDGARLAANWAAPRDGPGFWVLFAVFFPAVTGFAQGVSMSGELEDPGRSLPLGTFLAVGLSILVYLAAAVLFAGALPREVLIQDYASMKRIASVRFLVDAGVIAASLSSGMASFLGAPRILQSMARDRIFPFLLPFAKGTGPSENPRRGVLLSCGIAFATVALGNLNLIAPVVSMFFLISYGLLNYATFYEARAASPSFRPRFRWFDARLSLLGGLACLGAMLAIDAAAGVVATALLFSIYQYLRRTAGPARWADSRRAYHLQRLREHLLAAAREPEHPRDWRPFLLAFSDDPARRERLLRFASWVEGPSGITTVVRLLEEVGKDMPKQKAEAELRKDLARYQAEAFPLVVTVPYLRVGVSTVVQAHGVGPLRANTILLNWREPLPGGAGAAGDRTYVDSLETAFRLRSNILVLDAKEEAWAALESLPSNRRRIDVWWRNDATSRLLLLLAHLVTRNEAWSEARIRVLSTAEGKGGKSYASIVEALRKTLEEVRIEAEPEVVVRTDVAAVVEQSANAALVFLPFRVNKKEGRLVVPFGISLEECLPSLPVVALGRAAEDIPLDPDPEQGKPAEIAAVLDSFSDAKKRAEEAQRRAEKMWKEAEKRLERLRETSAEGVDEQTRARIEAAVAEGLERAQKAARRARQAEVEKEQAAQEAEAAGIPVEDEEEDQEGDGKVEGGEGEEEKP